MDIVNLIRAVKCREAIWNRQHPQYKDRDASLLLWTQVADETGVDVETARGKWRGLRDTFRVQLRKLNQCERTGAPHPLTWEYFEEMIFVKDQIYIDVNRKKYYRNYVDECARSSGDLTYRDDDSSEGNDSSTARPNGAAPSAVYSSSTRKTASSVRVNGSSSVLTSAARGGDDDDSSVDSDYKTPAELCVAEVNEDVDGRLVFEAAADDRVTTGSPTDDDELTLIDRSASVPLLQKKLRALQDDNYCFLMSLLPQLKSLPTKKKLFVRLKIQELLYTEILKMDKK